VFNVNHHAPATYAPVIPQKSGGAFGIPEYMPPIRRHDFQGKGMVNFGLRRGKYWIFGLFVV
ncbi:hypothetical protein, partial [Staphylococcus pseudintermedius]|uniref:hypothetical protein n=1 Tax=Staphylococcus pseudintermedius TaxID=283734 RepID=UPI001E54D035